MPQVILHVVRFIPSLFYVLPGFYKQPCQKRRIQVKPKMVGVEADKGWAWLVSLGTFAAEFLETGIVKALGVLLPALREQFATQTWIIGLIISIVPGIGAITCKYGR